MSKEKQCPKISVVTPSLNQGRYIRQSIESVLLQHYSNLEFIIIDGGSNDETISIIKEYAENVTYWVTEPDNGQSDAINKGFERATGDIVTWLNADDYYLSGAFEAIAKAYQFDSLAPFYFGDGLRVDEFGGVISNFFPAGRLFFDREALLMGLNYILQPSAFINRSSLEQIGFLDTNLHYGMDSDLWMRLSSIGTPCAVNSVLAATREYATTKTASGSFARVEELRQISMKHTDLSMTPGAMCYFFDTFLRFAQQNEQVFPPAYQGDIVAFWKKTQKLLEEYNAGVDGFPLQANGGSGMKIGIDIRPLIIGASGGMSQLIQGVCEHMFALHPEHQFLVFCTPFNRSLLSYEGSNVNYHSLPMAGYFESLDGIAAEAGIHVLVRSYPMEDTLQFPVNKQIFVIPDNQHETYPEFFSPEALASRRIAFSKALGGAGAIAAISEFSKQALKEYPGTHCKDIFIVEPSLQVVHKLSADGANLSEEEKKLIPDADFFLFPANLWKHKNHRKMFEAFRIFLDKSSAKDKVELVLTGNISGWDELFKDFSDLPIRHFGFVRPEFLRALLERARALVFFSLYEGFGMPLLEAFDAGTPVVCSNTTSIPEVGGDAVLTCSPDDVEAMSTLMLRITTDNELREKLVALGKERLKAYSWDKSAHSLIAACERVRYFKAQLEPARDIAKQSSPLVTIVTPSFNQGRFLKRTIESVLSQSYQNIEYMIMDGGSTDESVEILRSYGDHFYWVSEKDGGQTDAINKGMIRANGEILAYLNSDDVLMPRAIERIIKYFNEHPDCGMVYGKADYIDENDGFLGEYNTAEYSFERLMQDCMVCQPAAFWRKSVADKVGLFDAGLNFVMDYDYWMRIAKAGVGISFLPEKISCSRLYQDTKTMSSRAQIYDEIFKVSRTHADYVHVSHYYGYWYYRIFEKCDIASRIMRHIPRKHLTLGWLNHKWDHRSQYARRHVAIFARGVAIKIVVKLGMAPMLRRLREGCRWLLSYPDEVAVLGGKQKVLGFYSDNWLSDKMIIPAKNHASGQLLHIAGVAPKNTTMTIYAAGHMVLQRNILANTYSKVELLAELVNNETIEIEIEFSNFIGDAAGRRLAFLLKDTNMFTEHDAY